MDVQLIVGCVSIACPYSCRFLANGLMHQCLRDRNLWDTVGQFHVSVDCSTRASSLKVERQDRSQVLPEVNNRLHPFQDMTGNRKIMRNMGKKNSTWVYCPLHVAQAAGRTWGLYIQRASTSEDWVRPACGSRTVDLHKAGEPCAARCVWLIENDADTGWSFRTFFIFSIFFHGRPPSAFWSFDLNQFPWPPHDERLGGLTGVADWGSGHDFSFSSGDDLSFSSLFFLGAFP